MTCESSQQRGFPYLAFLTLSALGIVYGDIGTSPLYAFRECFNLEHGVLPTHANVLGIVSLIFWCITIIVSVKYIVLVLRADNRGEGGVLALMVLALSKLEQSYENSSKAKRSPESAARAEAIRRRLIITFALSGAALLYGDGIITPAISVLSAVEGLKIATPIFEPYITKITVIILFLLFLVQRSGTGKIGVFFGPIITLWFVSIGVLGIPAIFNNPSILEALNPWHGVHFLFNAGFQGFLTLGGVFLALTGAEAMYADMGHFGKTPIRVGWFFVALPALLLNYFGQGALILSDPSKADNPFFLLVPSSLLYPMVGLATIATVIASQALISGAFSITHQAVQLGYLPRMVMRHTSSLEKGQIYIPFVNWSLLIATIVLVETFHTSSNLAAAYGIAVSITMVITTMLMYTVARTIWKWKPRRAILIIGLFLIVDLAFLTSNILKFFHGGWVPIILGIGVFTFMSTWWRGREILWQRLNDHVEPFEQFFSKLTPEMFTRVPGTAIFLIRDLNVTPPALIYNIRHNKVVHEKVILLTVVSDAYPIYDKDFERVEIQDLGGGFFRVIIHFGFMESPNVPEVLAESLQEKLDLDLKHATFFLDRVIPIPTDIPGMAIWREKLFALMSQNALRATTFFQIPAEQVIEIGFQVEI